MPLSPHPSHRRRARRRVASVALAVGLALAVSACSGDDGGVRDDAGDVVKAGPWSVFDLRPGDCLSPPADLVGAAASIAVVPCADAHTQEVFSVVTHPADAFPGVATLQRFADGRCASELGTTLGLSTTDGWFVSYLLPSFDSWNKRGDRTVTCVLVFPNEPNRTGSVVRDRRTVMPTTGMPATSTTAGS